MVFSDTKASSEKEQSWSQWTSSGNLLEKRKDKKDECSFQTNRTMGFHAVFFFFLSNHFSIAMRASSSNDSHSLCVVDQALSCFYSARSHRSSLFSLSISICLFHCLWWRDGRRCWIPLWMSYWRSSSETNISFKTIVDLRLSEDETIRRVNVCWIDPFSIEVFEKAGNEQQTLSPWERTGNPRTLTAAQRSLRSVVQQTFGEEVVRSLLFRFESDEFPYPFQLSTDNWHCPEDEISSRRSMTKGEWMFFSLVVNLIALTKRWLFFCSKTELNCTRQSYSMGNGWNHRKHRSPRSTNQLREDIHQRWRHLSNDWRLRGVEIQPLISYRIWEEMYYYPIDLQRLGKILSTFIPDVAKADIEFRQCLERFQSLNK